VRIWCLVVWHAHLVSASAAVRRTPFEKFEKFAKVGWFDPARADFLVADPSSLAQGLCGSGLKVLPLRAGFTRPSEDLGGVFLEPVLPDSRNG